MSNEASPKCPQCGTPIKTDAPAGLCPNCLMALNLKTETVLTGDTSAAEPPLPPEELAPHFPQLEILGCLGRGGMGVVYKARQRSLNRLVALKLLAPERVTDGKFAERFTREAHALAALNHPHIVTVYDFGQAGGFYFLLMEFVDGVNLRQLLQAKKLTPEEALTVIPPLCDALQYAHEHGIVHRDIKPENLLLDKGGRVKIADFGIAKMVGDDSSVGVAESQPAGTPQYMAPEQKEHQRTDHRADIYSLGVVLYEMLTGELPGEKLQAPSRKVQIDVRLDEIVLRALEKTPELRYQTAGEMRTQVENVKSKEAVAQAAPSTSLPGTRFRLFEERGGRRVIVWRNVLVAAIAFLALALVVGAASSLVANGASPFSIVVAFAGLAAFLTLAAAVPISLKSGASLRSEPDDSTGLPRFSRPAIIGACWVPMTLFSFVATAIATFTIRGDSSKGPEWWQLAILIPALILGVAGPFGTTILGWVAVSQIRRSAGRTHGLQLALFDGLVFPLMVLSGVIAVGNVAVAKMFVDFYANPSAIGNPNIGLVTRLAIWLSQNNGVAVAVGVVAAIAVDVLVFRTVLRAVRGDVSPATPETRATNNEIKTASIAIIFASIAASLGALGAFRSAGAWPAMALSLLFAGLAIFMALPVRRLGLGKCALIIAALGAVIWPLVAFLVQPRRVAERAQVAGIGKVEVAADRALIRQPHYDLEGMSIMFGSASNRWTPSGVFLEAMFDVTLEPHRFDGGATWIIKTRHGIYSNYRLDGPPGPMLGQITFHTGNATNEPDGSYVIGEFKPDIGKPLPIVVQLDKTAPAQVARHPSAGLGIALNKQNGRIVIGSIIPNNPAARDGRLKPGDEVIGVEEQGRTMVSLEGMALADVVKRLRGEPGSVVTLLVVPAGQPAANPVLVKLTRENLPLLEREAEAQSLTNPPIARKVSSMPVQRAFPLRHKLGSDLVEELRRAVIAERSGCSAKYSDDNQSIIIMAPPDVLTRAQTFITVTDWPDPLQSLNGPTYLTDTVLRTSRSVFHACAVEASAETLSSLLSLHVLAELRGGEKSQEYQNYMMGGIPDPAWEKALRGDWPGKREALQRFVQEWNRYPLKRLTEEAGIALGFGVKHFCSVSFEGAPEEFYRITIEPDRTERGTSQDKFFFSELPPWWKPGKHVANAATTNAALLDLPYQLFDQTPHSGWRVLAQDGGLFHEAARLIEAYLSHDGLGIDQRVNLHFHAAQCLAFAGDAKSVLDALGHLKQAHYVTEPPDFPLRWNDYVNATEAFLTGDRDALKAARERIAAGPKLNGVPANLDVVDGLIARFGKSYRDAYGTETEKTDRANEALGK